ncbi:mitochondrial genome maintenance MGM101-domain-containing protein [Tricharina praecox]|uniref:mitochondrial genome maintenance MGM101-domain-containing protein n=1 Tax=Tricharina praecox TaxID=43433 RepID=UPI00221F10BF|nr:mitochondrial genome maintenance MGM101-domain-containing protein [Tricharina praecox]KAI5848087.1 mitochondrial genome maintenance MGM101-domain-containing protein [Tricharina praecox]
MASAVRRSFLTLARTQSRQLTASHPSVFTAIRRFTNGDDFPSFPSKSSSSSSASAPIPNTHNIRDNGLNDSFEIIDEKMDWSRSFHGLSTEAFPKETADVLLAPLAPEEVEIKPDGILYLPEIKYRRILNKAFGPGGWGLAPRGESIVTDKVVTREYALICHGRLVSIARGEQQYFDPNGIPTATEGCKSNALMRCCKDLGVASELWDPRFIRKFKKEYCDEKFVEHAVTKKKRKLWKLKVDSFEYPYKAT